MRICEFCGFDNAPEGDEACPLCGEAPTPPPVQDEVPTLSVDTEEGGRRSAAAPGTRYPVGHCFAGRYRIDAFLGSGGMGRVYKVFDLKEERVLALKTLLPWVMESPEAVERFRREVTMLGRIEHPAVPRVFGWGQHLGEYFFAAEFVDGKDLHELTRERGRWPVDEAAQCVATVAEALHAAHEQGIVHRDVKPHNIMIATDGSVHLVDFGVARGVGLDLKTITASGMVVGTPEYMAPEQLDSHRVDRRSDIYSLGVVLFELAIGRPPFEGETPMSVAWLHRTEPPPLPRSLRPDLPAWLERVVLKCLEKDPVRRFATAAALAAELRRERPGRPTRRALPSGDLVLEDESETTDWALVLASREEKLRWALGMALRFADRHYRLEEICPPLSRSDRWVYRFSQWNPDEVFRRLVDYERDCEEEASRRKRSTPFNVRKWLGGDGS